MNSVEHIGNDMHVLRRAGERIVFDARRLAYAFASEDGVGDAASSLLLRRNDAKINLAEPIVNRFRIEITFRCNAACSYCLVSGNLDPVRQQDMSADTARNIATRFNGQIQDGSLMIMGGEPLLNWSAVARFVQDVRGEIYIFTNGAPLTPAMARMLSRPNVYVIVSLDGPGPGDNAQRKLKNGRPLFPKAVAAIELLKRHGVNTGLGLLATDRNVDTLAAKVAQLFDRFEPVTVGVNHPHFSRRSAIPLDMGRFAEQLKELFYWSKKHGRHIPQVAQRLAPLLTGRPRTAACKICGEQITFLPDGAETLCTKLDSLGEAAPSLRQLQANLPLTNTFCSGCLARGACGGGCPWDAAMRFSHGVDERECELTPPLLEAMLWNIHDESAGMTNHDELLKRYGRSASW